MKIIKNGGGILHSVNAECKTSKSQCFKLKDIKIGMPYLL